MTALADMRAALESEPPPAKGKRRFVVVGRSARLALMAEAAGLATIEDKERAPTRLGPYPIIYVNDENLPGWDIVDKPLAWKPASK
jgi:hypothetical protein